MQLLLNMQDNIPARQHASRLTILAAVNVVSEQLLTASETTTSGPAPSDATESESHWV